MDELKRIHAAAEAIEKAVGRADVGLILGSGLGDSITGLKNVKTIEYEDIPGFPRATVPGHSGQWCCGEMGGKRIAMMRGRFHFYEGHSIQDVVLPIRVMKLLGVKTLLVTNAAGGVNTSFNPGDLMLIRDFINYSGINPLIGPNLDEFGPRFPDMSQAISRRLLSVARDCASAQGLQDLREGVYMWFSGPSFETPAEIRMARTLGADAVGMSTVPEIIVAHHMGMEILGISCITNMAAGILDQPLSHQEVIETGLKVQRSFAGLIEKIVQAI